MNDAATASTSPWPEPLIDALAGPGWYLQDNFIDGQEVDQLVGELRSLEQAQGFRPAGVGQARIQNATIRGDWIAWLDPQQCGPAQLRHLQRLTDLMAQLNRELFLGLVDLECHAALYRPGSGYQHHSDNFLSSNSRAITLLLYLNRDWQEADGGQLRLYLDSTDSAAHLDIAPRAGRLLAFLSERFPHEVLPTRRDRLSLTGWLRRRALS